MTYLQYGLRCPLCADVIYSNTRHDFEVCLCGAMFIDGGFDYVRSGGMDERITDEALVGAERVTRPVERKGKDRLPFYYSDEPERTAALMAAKG